MDTSFTSGFAVRRGDHVCVPCTGEEDVRELRGVHLTTALECGERIIFVIPDGASDAVPAGLPVTPASARTLVDRGQLAVRPEFSQWAAVRTLLDPDEMTGLLRREVDQAILAGYLGLRVCVDMGWNGAAGTSAVLEIERRLTALMTAGELAGLALICHYDAAAVPGPELAALRAAHSMVLDPEQARRREPLLRVTPLDGRAGLRLHGEIDRSNVAEFAAALREARRAGEHLHLDVGELRYADLAALRLLAQTAGELAQGERLVLHGPTPIVRTTLRIYGWDRLPALHIEGRAA